MPSPLCLFSRLARLLSPAPLAYITYKATLATITTVLPGLEAGPGTLVSPASLALAPAAIVLILGAIFGPTPATILAVVAFGSASILAGWTGYQGLLLGVAGSLALYSLYVRCRGIRDPFDSRLECPGPCPLVWLGSEALLIGASAALAVVPFMVVSRILNATVKLAAYLPPDTAPAYLALVESPW